MNQNLAEIVRNEAGNYYRDGYNCAESVFLAVRPYVAPEINPEVVKMLTGFGGGIGGAGCTCGALTGSIMIINLLKGRENNKGDRKPAYQSAKKFHDIFKDNFKSTCCRALNRHPFGSTEHGRTCLKITGNTAKLLMEFLQEQ